MSSTRALARATPLPLLLACTLLLLSYTLTLTHSLSTTATTSTTSTTATTKAFTKRAHALSSTLLRSKLIAPLPNIGPLKLGVQPLTPTYNALDRPLKGTNQPVLVSVGIRLIKLTSISDIDETLGANILFNIKWHDPRLKNIITQENAPERIDPMQIWTPDITLANPAKPEEILSETIKLDHHGNVEIVRSGLFTATVDLNVDYFPFDVQNMEFLFECPSYDGAQVALSVNQKLSTTIGGSENIWALDKWAVREEIRSSRVNGEPDSYLIGRAQVRRLYWMAVITLVVPLFIIANFAFIAFFVTMGDFGTRVSIVSTSFLTLVAFLFVINDQMPRIAYMTWLHKYCTITILIVMGTQYIVVFEHYLDPKDKETKLNDMINELAFNDVGPAITKAKLGTKKLRDNGRLPRGRLLLEDDDFDDHETVFMAYDAFFRHVDTNGDGRIDAKELLAALKVLQLQDGSNMDEEDSRQIIKMWSFDEEAENDEEEEEDMNKKKAVTLSLPEFLAYALNQKKVEKKEGRLSLIERLGGNEESKICFGKFTPRHAKVIDYWATRLTIGGYTLVTIVMLIQAKVHRDQYEFQLTVGPV